MDVGFYIGSGVWILLEGGLGYVFLYVRTAGSKRGGGEGTKGLKEYIYAYTYGYMPIHLYLYTYNTVPNATANT